MHMCYFHLDTFKQVISCRRAIEGRPFGSGRHVALPLIASMVQAIVCVCVGGGALWTLSPANEKEAGLEIDIFAHPSSHRVAPLLFLSSLPRSDQLCC